MNKSQTSRRDFLKSSTLISAGILGSISMAACSPSVSYKQPSPFPRFSGEGYQSSDGFAGLLFSQVGYELNHPVKIIVRLPKKEALSAKASCQFIPVDNKINYESTCIYWGEIWGSHWWIATFNKINEPGEWDIEINDNGIVVFQDTGLKVAKDILWNSTIEWSSVDMLERRRHFTGLGVGWQDAGSPRCVNDVQGIPRNEKT